MWMCYPSWKKTQKWVSESGSSVSCAKCSYDGQTEYSSPLCLMHFSFRFLEFSLTQVGINTHFQTLCTFVYWDTSLVGSPHCPASCTDKWVSRILKTFPVWSIYGCKQVTPKVNIFEEPSTLTISQFLWMGNLAEAQPELGLGSLARLQSRWQAGLWSAEALDDWSWTIHFQDSLLT